MSKKLTIKKKKRNSGAAVEETELILRRLLRGRNPRQVLAKGLRSSESDGVFRTLASPGPLRRILLSFQHEFTPEKEALLLCRGTLQRQRR